MDSDFTVEDDADFIISDLIGDGVDGNRFWGWAWSTAETEGAVEVSVGENVILDSGTGLMTETNRDNVRRS